MAPLSYASYPSPRKSFASADRAIVYTNRDQDYMDYVESFLANDGDMNHNENNNFGMSDEIMNGGKFDEEYM